MRQTVTLSSIYAVVVIAGMLFAATDQLAVGDVLLFLTPISGVFALVIGFSVARQQ